MATRITIIGAGQMGLVMSDALVAGGASVRLWGTVHDNLPELAKTRRSERLPEFVLPNSVRVIENDNDIDAGGVDLLLNAVPTQFIRDVWGRIAAHVPDDASIFCVSKGIEIDTLLRPTQVIGEMIAEYQRGAAKTTQFDIDALEARMCVLSGPTIAGELARHLPATMVASSQNAELALRVQKLFERVPWLRVYHHDDPIGVELAGAAKNVIALAAGMIDGLGSGDNAKSALLARGLAEIARLGTAMGAQRETFFGVAGVGDLATTCFSPSGRNRSCGERLGKGEKLDDVLAHTMSVVEGVPTSRALRKLADQYQVEMPLCAAVHAILYEGLSPADAIEALMSRKQTKERVS